MEIAGFGNQPIESILATGSSEIKGEYAQMVCLHY